MIRSPHILVRTLLEAGELPPGDEAPSPDDIDPKDYAMNVVKRTWPGDPVGEYYQRLLAQLKGRPSRKVGNNTYLEKLADWIGVRLHNTYVVRVTPDNTVYATTGGWHTVTTMDRLKSWLPGHWNVYRRQNETYWYNWRHPIDGTTMRVEQPFTDGDKILPDGTLVPQAQPVFKKKRQRREVTPAN